MDIKTDPSISTITKTFPKHILSRYLEFRTLSVDAANKIDHIRWLEETVKWGELSFKSNIGSPFRFGWNPQRPNQFGIYFICTTTLVETFRQLYPDFFHFDGNRGLIFETKETFPIEPLSHCLRLALTYKKVRNLPLLGA